MLWCHQSFIETSQGFISSMLLLSQNKCYINLFHFHPNSNKATTTKLCIWHDNGTVVACAQFFADLLSNHLTTAMSMFHRTQTSRIKVVSETSPRWEGWEVSAKGAGCPLRLPYKAVCVGGELPGRNCPTLLPHWNEETALVDKSPHHPTRPTHKVRLRMFFNISNNKGKFSL